MNRRSKARRVANHPRTFLIILSSILSYIRRILLSKTAFEAMSKTTRREQCFFTAMQPKTKMTGAADKGCHTRSSRTTRTTPKNYRAPCTKNLSHTRYEHGRSLRGGGGLRPQGVLDPPPPAQHGQRVVNDTQELSSNPLCKCKYCSNLLSKVLGRPRLRARTAPPPAKSR